MDGWSSLSSGMYLELREVGGRGPRQIGTGGANGACMHCCWHLSGGIQIMHDG